MNLSKLRETVEDTGAQHAVVHNLVTEQQLLKVKSKNQTHSKIHPEFNKRTCMFSSDQTPQTMKYYVCNSPPGPSQAALVIKNLPANAGGIRDMGSIPSLGRDPEEGHGNPLQCSRLENPMNRGAWWAMVHGSQGVGHD